VSLPFGLAMAHNVFGGNKREQSRLIFKALSIMEAYL